MALMAATRFLADLRHGFSFISSVSANHVLACSIYRHSPPSLTIARYHSGNAPKVTLCANDCGKSKRNLSWDAKFQTSFIRIATKRLCLHMKTRNLISMAAFKPESSEQQLGKVNAFDNSFGLPELEADLRPSQEFLDTDSGPSEDKFEELSLENCQTNSKTVQEAENLAIETLAIRAITSVELRKKLCAKKFPSAIVDEALANLKARGFLNDYMYAESFTRSKWSSLYWGPRRIKQVLRRKGVTEADAEKATNRTFIDEDSDQVPFLGMSKESVNRLFKQALKQWTKGENAPVETRKARVIRWLQYRGFNWQITSFLIKKLESQYPLQGG